MEIKEKITFAGRGLLQTAPFHSAEESPSTILVNYLETETATEDHSVNPVEIPIATINLNMRQKAVSAETYRTSAVLTREQIVQSSFDALGQSKRILYHEMSNGIEKRLFEKYQESGEIERIAQRTKWQNFVLSKFGKWVDDIYTYIEDDQVGNEIHHQQANKLASKIRVLSNRIAVKSRRGPGNFVVLPSQLLMLLEECSAYVFDTTQKFTATNERFVLRGTLGNIQVYHDTHQIWDSGNILVGRKAGIDDPGVHFFEWYNEYMTIEVPEGTKLGLQSRQAMCDIGNYQGYYITGRIIVGKKPWWKKLFKLYRDV